MKVTIFSAVLSALLSGADAWIANSQIINKDSNSTIVTNALSNLYNISGSTMSQCLQCQTELAVGKEIALTRPDLIPKIFTKWCIKTGGDPGSCRASYSRNTVSHGYAGTDFANLLTLMDPMGYDGLYWCYFQNGVCDLPETPEFDLSSWWPSKLEAYEIAPVPSNKTFNVLHVSDFHIQMDYTVGSEGNCSQYMCGTPHNYNYDEPPVDYNFSTTLYESDAIGNLSFYNGSYYDSQYSFHKGDYVDVITQGNSSIWDPLTSFGGYLTDAPEVLINSSLKSMMQFQTDKNLDFEFAIFTGDLVDHDETHFIDYNVTIASEETIFRDMKYYLGNIPVYPVLGNHDTYPYGQLAQEISGYSNLYDWNADLMADLWKDNGWIDQKTAGFAKSHYTGYSVTTKRGLKVIALNSNTWYTANFYNFWGTDQPDTFGQFQFLIDELIESEKKGQRVWIIAHVPTGNTYSLPAPTKVFSQIIERFSPYTVAGIFFGHTHTDQFQVFYAGNGTESSKTIENVINFAWISQSITPLTRRNPSWRYYEVDAETFSIVDSVNFYTRLNDSFANDGDEPQWEFEYSARESYDPDGNFATNYPLNATFWHHVADNIKSNITVNQLYTDYQVRNTPFKHDCVNSTECDSNYCYVTSFTGDQYSACLAEFDVQDTYA